MMVMVLVERVSFPEKAFDLEKETSGVGKDAQSDG
jgi:hypothetical protein